MKAWLYDTESGLYAGEIFAEPDMLRHEDGLTTTPPPPFGHGQVPVFDRQRDCWTVVTIPIARQLLRTGGRGATETY
jgi:hypothetical protein